MEIFIIRHATANRSSIDHQEGLSDHGIKEANITASLLAKDCKRVDIILTSPKKRAFETAQILAKTLHISEDKLVTTDQLKSLSSPEEAIIALEKYAHLEKIVLVSHLPLVSFLGSKLLTNGWDLIMDFQPGSCVKIVKENFAAKTGLLKWFFSPQIF